MSQNLSSSLCLCFRQLTYFISFAQISISISFSLVSGKTFRLSHLTIEVGVEGTREIKLILFQTLFHTCRDGLLPVWRNIARANPFAALSTSKVVFSTSFHPDSTFHYIAYFNATLCYKDAKVNLY